MPEIKTRKDLKNPMISVIMPTFNEAGNLPELIKRTEKTLKKDFEIIVVDDNSPDGTSEVVKMMQKERPWLRLVTRTVERGLPTAIKRGIKEARGEVVAWLDCGLDMPPEKIVEMMTNLPDWDIVVGSTFVKGARDDRGSITSVFSRVINLLCQLILDPSVTDFTSGFLVAKKQLRIPFLTVLTGLTLLVFCTGPKNKAIKLKKFPISLNLDTTANQKSIILGYISKPDWSI
jgi:glycosyltransferase involved in cell wall biosynthesis